MDFFDRGRHFPVCCMENVLLRSIFGGNKVVLSLGGTLRRGRHGCILCNAVEETVPGKTKNVDDICIRNAAKRGCGMQMAHCAKL